MGLTSSSDLTKHDKTGSWKLAINADCSLGDASGAAGLITGIIGSAVVMTYLL